VKFLFWQFALYAIAAFGLGFVAAWSWFREQLRRVEMALERTRVRVNDAQDARRQLHEARAAAATATESLAVLRERFTDSETVRSAVEVEVESLRSGRLKLLSELSELRSLLDSASVSRARLTAAEHEATRLRGLLDDADLQLRTERVARTQTLAMMQSRLLEVETELATLRLAPSVIRAESAVRNGDAGIRPLVTHHLSDNDLVANHLAADRLARDRFDAERLARDRFDDDHFAEDPEDADLSAASRVASNVENRTTGRSGPTESAGPTSEESDDPEPGSFSITVEPGDHVPQAVKSVTAVSPWVTLYAEGPAQIVDLRNDAAIPASGE
jgi:hypothetical protein